MAKIVCISLSTSEPVAIRKNGRKADSLVDNAFYDSSPLPLPKIILHKPSQPRRPLPRPPTSTSTNPPSYQTSDQQPQKTAAQLRAEAMGLTPRIDNDQLRPASDAVIGGRYPNGVDEFDGVQEAMAERDAAMSKSADAVVHGRV